MTAAPDLGAIADAALGTQADRARRDFNNFAAWTLRDRDGSQLLQAALHRVWKLHVEFCWRAGRHPAILAPFGHGKTTQLVVGRVAFEIGRDINLRAKIICNTDGKAMERVMGIQAILRSPRYRLLYPHVRPVPPEAVRRQGKQAKMTQHELFLDRPGFSLDATVQAAGVLTAGTGGRADLMVFDDIVDQRNALDEPKLRDKVADNVDNVWMQRCEPDARVLLVATPWHQADYIHRILERPAWCVLRQWISEDFRRINQEVYNAPEGYPIPAHQAPPNGSTHAADSVHRLKQEMLIDRLQKEAGEKPRR